MPAQRRSSRIPMRVVGILGMALAGYGLYHRTHWYREGNQLFYANRRPNGAGRAFGDTAAPVADASAAHAPGAAEAR